MKNVIGIAVLVVLGAVGYFMSRSADKAIEYNDRIVNLQMKFMQSMIEMSKALESGDAARVEKERRKGIAQKSKEIQKRRKQW